MRDLLPAFERPVVRQTLWSVAGFLYLLFVIQRFYPATAGTLVIGGVLGSLTALLAFGMILVYRANRIVNFAQGDIGGAAGALAVQLVVGPRVPYVAALLLCFVVAMGIGALVEVTVVRRFFRAPRLILTVATIGLAQILAAFQLAVPRMFDQTIPSQQFPTPFDFRFFVGSTVITGNHVLAVVVVLACVVGLTAFFKYSAVGIAIRASAENADRASLLGVPVKRISTVVWVIAAGLSALAAILRAPIVGVAIGSVLGPSLLLRALAAAVVGRMENLRVTFLAAVGLGMLEHAVFYNTSRTIVSDSILFVVIIVALLVQRRGIVSRADQLDASSWSAAAEVRPVPAELRHLPEVRWGLFGVKALVGVVAVALPLLLPVSRVNLLSLMLIYGIVGLSLVVLTGWTGQISLGQLAFTGMGAAVSGVLVESRGMHFLPAMVAAGLVGILVAIVIGLPALRIRGLFLAVTTLAFGLTAQQFLLNGEFFPWLVPDGRIDRPVLWGEAGFESERLFYFFVLAWLLFSVRMLRVVRRSRTGRVLVATRDNPQAAQAYGVNVTGARLSAFALSGFLGALAGALMMYHQHGVFSTTPFAPAASLRVFSAVVIGGLGSVPGVLLGAFYVQGAEYFLTSAWRFLATGAGLLILLMVFPGGIGQIVYQVRDTLLLRIASRRELLVPSLVADRRVGSPEPEPEPAPAPARRRRTRAVAPSET